jgi:hypothetical protein
MFEKSKHILDKYVEEQKLNTISYLIYALQFKCYSKEDKKAFREAIINLSKGV